MSNFDPLEGRIIPKKPVKPRFEAIVAVYGIPYKDGKILSEQAAMNLFDTLRGQTGLLSQLQTINTMPGYKIIDVRIEGNREHGKVYATFERI